jgi:hypothetical protein
MEASTAKNVAVFSQPFNGLGIDKALLSSECDTEQC